MLGQYKVISQQGHGGMATIYKAYHARLDRYVAVKVMHQAFQEDPGFLSRFEREAQIVARLEHPNIVPVYDFAEVGGQPYLVMKYIEGRTLKALNERSGITLEDILRILPPVASAIDYAHKQGVLHRDIKPSNIIIASDGTPFVADFGLAKLAQLGESTLSADVLLGTPNYISPEQAQGRKDVDHRTDLYSLGVVLYELVVGRVPFSADTPFAVVHDHIYKPLPAPSRLNPDITPQVEAVLAKALAKNPADRYESATAMVRAFADAVKSSGMKNLDPNRGRRATEILEGSFDSSAPVAVTPAASTGFDPFAQVIDDAQQVIGSVEQLDVPDSETYVIHTPPPAPKLPRTPRPSVDLPPMPPLPPMPEMPKMPSMQSMSGEKPKRAANVSWEINGKQGEFNWDDLKQNLKDSVPQIGSVIKDVGSQIANTNWGEIGKDIGETIEELEDGGKTTFYSDDDQGARKRAEYQINKRKEFTGHAVAYVLVNIGLLVTNIGLFSAEPDMFLWWPIVGLAWGSGLVAHAIETYFETGPRLAKRTRTVQDALYNSFGANWRKAERTQRKEFRKVRRRAEKPFTDKREFFQHLGVYTLIIAMMWFIFFMIGTIEPDIMTVPWPAFVMGGWGLGLLGDGMSKLRSGSREASIAREMARERELLGNSEKLKNDHIGLDDLEGDEPSSSVRLTPDGEFTDSMVSEMLDSDRARNARRR